MDVVNFHLAEEMYKAILADDVFSFPYIERGTPFKVEYIDRDFKDVFDFMDWVKQNPREFLNFKVMIYINYLMDEQYYNQRFKGKYNKVYLVKRDVDAIITIQEVTGGVEIETCDYDSYKKSLLKAVFN